MEFQTLICANSEEVWEKALALCSVADASRLYMMTCGLEAYADKRRKTPRKLKWEFLLSGISRATAVASDRELGDYVVRERDVFRNYTNWSCGPSRQDPDWYRYKLGVTTIVDTATLNQNHYNEFNSPRVPWDISSAMHNAFAGGVKDAATKLSEKYPAMNTWLTDVAYKIHERQYR